MKVIVLGLAGLSVFLFFTPVLLQRDVQSYTWQVEIPETFPRFFSSNAMHDLLLNDLFYRHYSGQLYGPEDPDNPQTPDFTPGALTGVMQTDWREWDAITTLWIKTAENKITATTNFPGVYDDGTGDFRACWPEDNQHDFNAELRCALLHTRLDSDGYVWTFGNMNRGWPFPRPACNSPEQSGCYDTRHSVNNTAYILAAWRYFTWTQDTEFLQTITPSVRKAMHFLQTDLRGDEFSLIENHWPGHDGLVGEGHGLGSNWWDILPFGWRDAYATIQYYAALNSIAQMEQYKEEYPKIGIPPNPYGENSEIFAQKAEAVKQVAGNFFWWDPSWDGVDPATKDFTQGRFFGVFDKNNGIQDYGFVFLNLNAIYYGFATEDQANAIYNWLEGDYIFPEDTATGSEIYDWQFAPRATTKNNNGWYFWGWGGPTGDRTFPYGKQIQDGGTSFHLSYFDLIDRIRVKGPDNAYNRLTQILDWYEKVQGEGGYRAYYQKHEGSLQGCGTPGSIGIDCEFVESALVPTAFLYGFLGVKADINGLSIRPNLPTALSSAGVDSLFWQGQLYRITVSKDTTEPIVRHSDGKLELAVGDKTTYRVPFGQIPCLKEDIDCSGQISIQDLTKWREFWAVGDRSADLTGQKGVNVSDLLHLVTMIMSEAN